MTELSKVVEYTDKLLGVKGFRDYCPNGLQVEGRGEVKYIVSGVTACVDLIEAAVEDKADLVLVHHGYFWKGEPLPMVGMKARRIRRLLETDTSLLAYHLPLDAHPELGNNAQLAQLFGIKPAGVLDEESAKPIVFWGELEQEMTCEAFGDLIEKALGRRPMWIDAGTGPIKRVAWCSGGAQDYMHYATDAKMDAFVTGEISEPSTHEAREQGVHYFAAGHHATERYGVQALGGHLAEHFGLRHQFIDIDNPV